MNIKVNREILVNGLNIVYGAVNERSSLPILSNILIDALKNKLYLTSTNLDIGILYELPADVIEEGSITIPAKRFFDITKQTQEDEIFVTSKKNNSITIESPKSFFKMMGLPKEDFPKIPEFQEGIVFIVNQGTLKNMLRLTSFAVSRDETRYALNGILFSISKNNITLVATDGRRLAVTHAAEKQNENIAADIKKVIVPSKTITELNRILKDDGDVQITIKDNQAEFNIENIKIISRLIEGEFPNYNSVIPEKKDGIKINRDVFISSIRRVSIFTTQDSAGIKLDISKNKIVIYKQSPDIGEAREEIDVEYNGGNMTVGFNPDYIIDALKNIIDDEIELELNGPDRPAVIRREGYTYIVLPMQT